MAAVCWHKNRCRIDPVAARRLAPVVPPAPSRLGERDKLKALDFLFVECSVVYVPYCQQLVIDGQLPSLPSWRLQDIAKPSLEHNVFAEEKISIIDMPHIETLEQSRDLLVWLGTAEAET